jgi:hypothetical protein
MNSSKCAFAMSIFILAVSANPSQAQSPAIKITSGSTTGTIPYNGALTCTGGGTCTSTLLSFTSGTSGQVTFKGSVGNASVSITGTSFSPSSSPKALDLKVTAFGTGTVLVSLTDGGFLGGSELYLSGPTGGTATATVNGQAPPLVTLVKGGTVAGAKFSVNSSFVLTVTDSADLSAVGILNDDIATFAGTPVTSNCVAITAIAGMPIANVQLTGSGGVGGPYTFTETGLPLGLSISSAGVISGTPQASGTFNYTVTVTDSGGNVGTSNCSVTVGTPTPNMTSCVLNYPTGSAPLLSSVIFNESGVLQSFEQSKDGSQIRAWFTDEHAPVLGARATTLITSSGSSTTNYNFTAYNPASPAVYTPGVPLPVGDISIGLYNSIGTVKGTGVVPGTDTALQTSGYPGYGTLPGNVIAQAAGRPLWPSLFATDITPLTPGGMLNYNTSGDWQNGNTKAIPPEGIFGAWKGAVVTLDVTQSPPNMTVTTDADPATNTTASIPDTPITGFGGNLGYFTEAKWDVSALGLIPGRVYRIQVIVHDGDQNKSGGDVGEACLSPVYIPVTPLTLPPTTLPGGNMASPYTASLVSATGGTPTYPMGVATYSYSVDPTKLPPGLSLNPATGAISGIPTDQGTYSFTVTVTDSATPTPGTATQTYSIKVDGPLPLTLSCAVPGSTIGQVGSAFNTPALSASGGQAPYTFVTSGNPTALGLSLDSGTGAVTGTPTVTGTFTVQVKDHNNNTAGSCFYEVNACVLPNLGAGGSFSIFGLNNAQVNIQSSVNGGGTVAVAAGANLHVQGKSVLSDSIVADPGATVQVDKGASAPTPTTQSLTTAQSGAIAASAAFAALTPTQTISTPINNALTITGTHPQNVIAINAPVNLNGTGDILTISGTVNQTFVFNIAAGQNFQLQNGASISLTGGVTASQIVFNFIGNVTPAPRPGPGPGPAGGGNLQIQSGPQGTSNTFGVFLDPYGNITVQGGTHNSVFISGGQIQFQAGGPVTINPVSCSGPTPPTPLTLACPASSTGSLMASGGSGGYTYGFTGNSSLMIDGLTLNPGNGAFMGTATTLPLSFTGQVIDGTSTLATAACTITK